MDVIAEGIKATATEDETGGQATASQALARAICDRLDIERFVQRSFSEGACVMRFGQAATSIPYIEIGQLLAVLRPISGGTQVVPVTFERDAFAGLSYLFCDDGVSFDLVAASPSTVRWVSRREIEQVVQGSPELMLQLVRFLAMKLRNVQLRERTWLERGVRDRVRATLARMTHESVTASAGSTTLLVTHEELAMRCGISRPKLSAELKALEGLSVLRLSRGAIEILNPRLLTQ